MISRFWNTASAVPSYHWSSATCWLAGRMSKLSLRSVRRKVQPRWRWRIRLWALYCVATPMRRMPELSALESAKSMIRAVPPKCTAGLARRSVSSRSREPRPPASTSASVLRARPPGPKWTPFPFAASALATASLPLGSAGPRPGGVLPVSCGKNVPDAFWLRDAGAPPAAVQQAAPLVGEDQPSAADDLGLDPLRRVLLEDALDRVGLARVVQRHDQADPAGAELLIVGVVDAVVEQPAGRAARRPAGRRPGERRHRHAAQHAARGDGDAGRERGPDIGRDHGHEAGERAGLVALDRFLARGRRVGRGLRLLLDLAQRQAELGLDRVAGAEQAHLRALDAVALERVHRPLEVAPVAEDADDLEPGGAVHPYLSLPVPSGVASGAMPGPCSTRSWVCSRPPLSVSRNSSARPIRSQMLAAGPSWPCSPRLLRQRSSSARLRSAGSSG